MKRQPATSHNLEIWLREKLRGRSFYSQIVSLTVRRSDRNDSGWTADFEGDLSADDTRQFVGAIFELQILFVLSAAEQTELLPKSTISLHLAQA